MSLSNSQHDAIIREYNRTQFYHESERTAHINEIYTKIPRIHEIDEEVRNFGTSNAKRAARGEKISKDELKKHLSDLRDEKLSLLRANGYPEDYMELKYTCPKCRDTGYVDGNKKCSCYLQAATNLLYDQSGLSDILEEENFDTLSFEYYSKDPEDAEKNRTVFDNMTKIVDECRKYVANFPTEKGNLLFTGKTGCGKTFMSHCIAKALLDEGFSVVYITAEKLFELFADEALNRNNDDYTNRTQYIYDCDLLIIDDLGSEFSNSLTTPAFFTCVNDRLNQKKGTIISTNISIGKIRDNYSERILSRILGNYKYFYFYGQDIRTLKLKGERK